ncbi:MAG: hypothetical protein ABJL99_17055 [Aliishimia sp.]
MLSRDEMNMNSYTLLDWYKLHKCIPTSSLHRDPLTEFLFQVTGRKRLYLYSADQEELLYPFRSYNNYQPCWFKPENPNMSFSQRRDRQSACPSSST